MRRGVPGRRRLFRVAGPPVYRGVVPRPFHETDEGAFITAVPWWVRQETERRAPAQAGRSGRLEHPPRGGLHGPQRVEKRAGSRCSAPAQKAEITKRAVPVLVLPRFPSGGRLTEFSDPPRWRSPHWFPSPRVMETIDPPPAGAASGIAMPDSAAMRYWRESRRPLASLVFILPLLAGYELGVASVGVQAARNGVDAWLRGILDGAGFGQYFLLPLLSIGALLAWHHVSREPWRISRRILPLMLGESAMLAAALVGWGQLQRLLVEQSGWCNSPLAAGSNGALHSALARAVGFLGAGCYEELLFRLLLLPLFVLGLQWLGCARNGRLLGAVAMSSVLFSLAHYVGATGDTFSLYSFAFRFVAGVFFALLFVLRGFGIVAATHALYDIFVDAC